MEGAKEKFSARAIRRGREAYSALADYRYTTVAGTLTFFLIMSLVPFLFWLTFLFGSTGLNGVSELEIFGWAKDFLLYLSEHAEGASAGANVLFLATTLWSSTGFFYHLRRSGEIIYRHGRKSGFYLRLSAAALTLGVLFYFAATGALLFGVNYIARALPVAVYYVLVYSFILILSFFTAWILNAYVCPYRVSGGDTALGSFYTAAAWIVATVAFSVYLRFSSGERLYGALSLVIVFFLWLYWMMICFTAGVIYNRRRMETRGKANKIL